MTSEKSFDPILSRTKDEMRGEDFRDSQIYDLENEHLDTRRKEVGGVPGAEEFSRQDFWNDGQSDGHGEPSPPDYDAADLIPGLEGSRSGLAISGGGVRSATFALGLLQALARENLLKHFDYLSTVSGGGYIGSSLTWLLSEKFREKGGEPYGLDRDDFPFGTAKPKDRSDPRHWKGMLRYLREHAEYLAPNKDISILSGLAVVVRGILLNLLVWVPLFTLLFVILQFGWHVDGWTDLLFLVTNLDASDSGPPRIRELLAPGYLNLHEVLTMGGISLLLVFAVLSIAFSLASAVGGEGAFVRFSYRSRRWFEVKGKYLLPCGLLFIGVGVLPYAAAFFFSSIGSFGSAGAGTMLTGIASGLAAARKSENAIVKDILLPAIAVLLLVGGLILTCGIAIVVREGGNLEQPGDFVFAWFVVLALLTGYVVNTNYISVHRFYRDRLMEAFMPMQAAITGNQVRPAPGANEAQLDDLCDPGSFANYHLVNTNLILVDSDDALFRRRGGDNFVMSRIYCGGDAGGFHPTGDFSGGDMTLATAMTVSGAAAHPNSGWAGTGQTRNRAVSWLMNLLNIRLGYTVRNAAYDTLAPLAGKPNHFDNMKVELSPSAFDRHGKWFQLSDGGHFENLAIYELVRRRCKLILISDAGADPAFGFGDVQNTVRRVSQDFGVEITFGRPFWSREAYEAQTGSATSSGEDDGYGHWRNRLSSLVPQHLTGFPVEATRADHGYIIGTVTYPEVVAGAGKEIGILIYVKATMIDGLSLETRGYKADHPEFPHQSTADQFFDPAQFEAYRELGNAIGEDMIEGTRLKDLLGAAWGSADGDTDLPVPPPAAPE
ncbi:patatin-like phospholipase family protein [Nisaea sp.]|uniref:patatin-like phospholipase family protein n=1 Tax=Nisaea sp. TaxID=2024842 RepID=UPI0032974068